jgi:hypothetical protein
MKIWRSKMRIWEGGEEGLEEKGNEGWMNQK